MANTNIASRNPINKFSHGFLCPFKSVGFIRRRPSLYKFIILPLLVNILAFSLVLYLGLGFFQELVMARIPQGDAWYWLALNYFVVAVAVLVVLVLVFFTFAAVGSLLASPFNDLLSERCEILLTGEPDGQPFSLALFLADTGRTLVTEVKEISIFLIGMLLLMLLHLVPVVGIMLYPVLSVCWLAFFLVMEYTGYVFARKQMDFKAQRRVIFRHASAMAGFGLGLFCILAIPFLQFLCIPLGVVGAVRLLYDLGVLTPFTLEMK